MKTMQKYFMSTLSVFSALVSTQAVAADTLKILYEDRPPYYITNDTGTVSGLVLTPVRQALRKANIKPIWVTRSGKRQIADVKLNKEPVCSPGWFKKPARELFAKFSTPVYQDKPQVVILRADNAQRISHTKLEQLFADSTLRGGVKMGYSYGRYIDALRSEFQPTTVETSQNVGGMTRMLLGRRFDYLIAAPEEFQSITDRLGIAGEDIISLKMSDIPPGNKRYLMCSQSVSDDLIKRFNEALASLPKN